MAEEIFGSDLESVEGDADSENEQQQEDQQEEDKKSAASGSRSSSPASSRSRSGSASGASSRHSSPGGQRSGGEDGSPTGAGEGSVHSRSRSASPKSEGGEVSPKGSSRSGSPDGSKAGSPVREGSRSRSPTPVRDDASQSPAGSRSRSQTPVNEQDNRSQSPPANENEENEGQDRTPPGSGASSPASSAPSHRSPEVKRSRARVLSDDEEENSQQSNADKNEVKAVNVNPECIETSGLNDLFGDADDLDSDDNEDKKQQREGDDDEENRDRGERDGEAGEEQPEAPEEKRIEVEIPRINPDLGRQVQFVKMPNFLSVETRPFDPKYYEDEIIEDEVMDEEGRTRLKLKVENTVRWRYAMDKDGNVMMDDNGRPMHESNTRVVRWSDGSLSLHLGQEIFDVHQMPLQGDFNHLFIRQGTGLQGQAVFKSKLTFRPHSTDSATHRKVTMSMADRATKKAHNVKILSIIGKDPDAQRNEMIKKEEERLRASVRRESQQRRLREKAHQRGMSAGYLEADEDDDEGTISLSAIKKQFKGGKPGQRSNIYSSESDETSSSLSDDEPGKRKVSTRAKKIDSNEEDSDTEVKAKKARVVLSDSEDEDRGGVSNSGRAAVAAALANSSSGGSDVD